MRLTRLLSRLTTLVSVVDIASAAPPASLPMRTTFPTAVLPREPPPPMFWALRPLFVRRVADSREPADKDIEILEKPTPVMTVVAPLAEVTALVADEGGDGADALYLPEKEDEDDDDETHFFYEDSVLAGAGESVERESAPEAPAAGKDPCGKLKLLKNFASALAWLSIGKEIYKECE